MFRSFLIPIEALCLAVILLMAGQLACGTSLYYVAMMAIAMLSIGISYNWLGGLGHIRGWMYACFVSRNLVISQFLKVLLWERADRPMEAPETTITVYAVFYVCAMIGILLFGRVRLALPKPAEIVNLEKMRFLYWIVLGAGITAQLIYELNSVSYGSGTQYNNQRSLSQAFIPLFLFSIVLAVDIRIRESEGRHSVDYRVILPAGIYSLISFVDTIRGGMLAPLIVYLCTCFFRDFRFTRRHWIGGAAAAVTFIFFLSPFSLMLRGLVAEQTFANRIAISIRTVEAHHDPAEILQYAEAQSESETTQNRETYFLSNSNAVFNRLALIRPDSNLIAACANGYHYGTAALELDLAWEVPRMLGKKKVYYTGVDFLGRVSGVAGDQELSVFPAFTAVSDSYGAFGWLGTILFPILIFPFILVTNESVFEVNKPWGTIGFCLAIILVGELNLGKVLTVGVRIPLTLIVLSYFVKLLEFLVPARISEGTIMISPGQGH